MYMRDQCARAHTPKQYINDRRAFGVDSPTFADKFQGVCSGCQAWTASYTTVYCLWFLTSQRGFLHAMQVLYHGATSLGHFHGPILSVL